MDVQSTNICPVEGANALDVGIRKWFHNPRKIFAPYITPNMKILDIGCGPGFFSVELASLLEESGHITSVDLQQGMLDKISNKIKGTPLENKITLHKCSKNSLDLAGKFDFAFSFWVIHEIPDKLRLFNELNLLINSTGKILIVEPKVHTSKHYFAELEKTANQTGFKIIASPRVFFSRSILLQKIN